MDTIRLLGPGDEPALESFLAGHADSSMFLRANLRDAGIVDRGKTREGTYVARVEGDQITAVAAHFWNGRIVLQAPEHAGHIAADLVGRNVRGLTGLIGPWRQVLAACAALGLEGDPPQADQRQDLFALDLAALEVPAALASGRVRCRHSRDEELDLLADWRVAFGTEALGLRDGAALKEKSRRDVEWTHREGRLWILSDEERPVSMTAFNSQLPDCVQVGGVWTPPPMRGRGYARCAVAGSLLEARGRGVRRATLFAKSEPAKRAYRSLGFRVVGDYGVFLLDAPCGSK